MSESNILKDIFHHVTLPPKLPGHDDKEPQKVGSGLVDRLREALRVLHHTAEDNTKSVFQSLDEILKECRELNDGRVHRSVLLRAFKRLSSDHAIIVHVAEHNAALLFYQNKDGDSITVEAFEASPSAEPTLAARGALQWDFPGAAISLDKREFNKPRFQDNLAGFLMRASTEPVAEFMPKSRKAGVEVTEVRDTPDPDLITDFLITLLGVNGCRVKTPLLRKRIKDDVCWNHAERPWRRSSFWLVLRVCIQRLLYLRMGSEMGHLYYKSLLCVLLVHLLRDLFETRALAPEHWCWLRAKLCRRLTKLDILKDSLSAEAQTVHATLSHHLNPLYRQSLRIADNHIRQEWAAFKTQFQRMIPSLPRRAQTGDMILSLPNSISYLRKVLQQPQNNAPWFQRTSAVDSTNDTGGTAEKFTTMFQRYSSLAELEATIERDMRDTSTAEPDHDIDVCIETSRKIVDYLQRIGDAYDEDQVTFSIFILNLLELWVCMDKCATVAFPLLLEYHPVFIPESLDVLLLSRRTDLNRLSTVQQHLHARCAGLDGKSMTIFADPSPQCFADRYVQLGLDANLAELEAKIEAASLTARMEKAAELEEMNQEYESLTTKKMESECTQRMTPDGSHEIRGCGHCYYIRCLRRLRISVHEDYLPKRMAEKRAVLFELGIPQAFAAYRSASWSIIIRLGRQMELSAARAPQKVLGNYPNLSPYMKLIAYRRGYSLASTTKSYLETHYKQVRLPTTEKSVILPSGLTFKYYDERGIWARDVAETLTLAHHFALRLPREVPLAQLYSTPSFAPDGLGPSSYEALARYRECPSAVTIHEFMAHQALMAGKKRRWLQVLAELGSSNINFSAEHTMVLMRHLALQAGPELHGEPLRAVHVVFNDLSFCKRLIEQIDQHVSLIAPNWREVTCMETMLTFSVKVCSLGIHEASMQASEMLLKIRSVTHRWINHLREESRNATEVDAADKLARYCFLAALLCRRTFSGMIDTTFDEESIKTWVVATLSMQENLVMDTDSFGTLTQSMLVRDIMSSAQLREAIRTAINIHPLGVNAAIDQICGCVSGTHGTNETREQNYRFHFLEGHLSIDGSSIGKIPPDIRNSETLKALFGNQRLVAFPSDRNGMSYQLALKKNGYQVHLGFRDQKLVIQAHKRSQTLEHIPGSVFGPDTRPDLPHSLVHGCVHWLDLKTGILEARRVPHIWWERMSDWKIDIDTRKAIRRISHLVDPHSQLARTIAKIFNHFEQAPELTVVQHPRNPLSIELKRINLIFYVNSQRLLQCKQLSAEIDPNQDAGTLYGLQSMLVLRNVPSRSQRSIIVPLGSIKAERRGIHVLVTKDRTGNYGRYLIDEVLGRLQCPAEPLLLYTKAQLHAFTSFVLPDDLTRRTGTEEALSCLKSAYSQPWTPLASNIVDILLIISRLTPIREYYPPDRKFQQVVKWNEGWTVTMQHEAYEPIIESIITQSQRLSLFHPSTELCTRNPGKNEAYLRDRALWRRSMYERSDYWNEDKMQEVPDEVYWSRVYYSSSKRTCNSREIICLLRNRPSAVKTDCSLTDIIRAWSNVGGYNGIFTPTTLSTALSIDLRTEWGRLVRHCATSQADTAPFLMFTLGLMAYSPNANMKVLRVLAAFATLEPLKELPLPTYGAFENVRDKDKPASDLLLGLVLPACSVLQTVADQQKRGKKSRAITRKEAQAQHGLAVQQHKARCKTECERFVSFLLPQWPCAEPSIDGFKSEVLNAVKALAAVQPEWLRRYKNLQLLEHLDKVQEVLDAHSAPENELLDLPAMGQSEHFEPLPKPCSGVGVALGRDLLQTSGPLLRDAETMKTASFADQPRRSSQAITPNARLTYSQEIIELERLVEKIVDSGCSVRSRYGRDLQQSIHALKLKGHEPHKPYQNGLSYWEGLKKYDDEIKSAQAVVDSCYGRICAALLESDSRLFWLLKGNLGPCITPITILQQLGRSFARFGPRMKEAILSYGLEIVKLQRLLRIRDFFARRDQSRLDQVNCQISHAVWDYMRYPAWVLLEIDANVQIRQEQMNMGQGKTSVIMPMVACALANGKILARLLVPSALLTQTAQILQTHLGGLVGREVLHIPFSRRTQTTPSLIAEFRRFYEDTLHQSGVILGVPEHALSFKLSGLQRVSDAKTVEAAEMVAIQDWIDRYGRDILDECDFTLAVKTQLIYPSGSQLVVDGHPDRWEVVMKVLGLVAQHLRDLARIFPRSIDVIDREEAAFPVVYLLRNDVEVALLERIVNDACSARRSILPIQGCSAAEVEIIRRFLSDETVHDSVTEALEQIFEDKPQAIKRIYLLRGLLVHRILLLCLKKRWNVQYGLHPGRDPMAVPFHAKGVPSDQAEWGHPDVAILFTCLAFYHEGLTQKRCRQCLQSVLRADDPAIEYDRWTETSATMPESLKHWNLINVNDHGQTSEIWQHLRFSTTVINYYLRTFVFPVHAKQFAIKLQTSGWDVPFFDNSRTTSQTERMVLAGLTTGFSGTNDNRRLLPLTIEQHDLPELLHTNAEVLTYLLQKRNRGYWPAILHEKRISETQMLHSLARTKTRILIDAGAFILEMDNLTLVKTWLSHDTEAQAAVYFEPDDKPWVWFRAHNKSLPLLATPYADDMTDCLIYLDEAHTRGTDLKLPAKAQGALTLGLNQTKDHTVQAAMRLRQLGTTQSVVFIAPPEVHQNILDVCRKRHNDMLDSSDVIYWLLHQTCASNKDLEPLFNAQGTDFCRRVQAAEDYPNFITNRIQRKNFMRILQQPEQQTLEQLYKPRPPDVSDADSETSCCIEYTGRVAGFMQTLSQRKAQARDLHTSAMAGSALEEVEQEREVAYEIEEEREVERPRVMEPYEFPGLHPTLSYFAETGSLQGTGIQPAAKMMFATKLGTKYKGQVDLSMPHLYVSEEFTRTVQLKAGEKMDELTRPVNWLLSNMQTELAIAITPEEAEELIPLLRSRAAPSMHLITYAAPVTKRMQHFSNLNFYAIPPLANPDAVPAFLPFEVGLLAGRLYFGRNDYAEILDRLALELGDAAAAAAAAANANPAAGPTAAMEFLQEWLALRRQGQDISHTPMGYVCQGLALRADHPFFVGAETCAAMDGVLPSSGRGEGAGMEEEDFDSDGDEEDEGGHLDDAEEEDDHGDDEDESGQLDDVAEDDDEGDTDDADAEQPGNVDVEDMDVETDGELFM
ncbi:uncharacterized protein BO97DRAFT_465286 [Aspergillus homomorphus CBS 101889]|uniref:ubiquitinyl hydrolase 1 n=1 Tax=Aspergillus homomorphus (strain CBS 101889) TaxID=1450537 RepID=A0A395I4N3_ASPHC|nr:hypothetical protein BO97DRAFT_465286 [Aspergillus homomorphus CBS 101889]RAL14699.1 hypothetical protein BO97DRAFT_465286 [Aspergillus homomorphus CBS 101889]